MYHSKEHHSQTPEGSLASGDYRERMRRQVSARMKASSGADSWEVAIPPPVVKEEVETDQCSLMATRDGLPKLEIEDPSLGANCDARHARLLCFATVSGTAPPQHNRAARLASREAVGWGMREC